MYVVYTPQEVRQRKGERDGSVGEGGQEAANQVGPGQSVREDY